MVFLKASCPHGSECNLYKPQETLEAGQTSDVLSQNLTAGLPASPGSAQLAPQTSGTSESANVEP